MTKRWEYAETVGVERINDYARDGWRVVALPWRGDISVLMEREIPEPAPEAVPVEPDTPERAAEILREGGYRGACVIDGCVYYGPSLFTAIGEFWIYGMNGDAAERNGLSWPDAARECLRRWPVTP